MGTQILNIDSKFQTLLDDQVTARLIDTDVSMYAFGNFNEIEKRKEFVLDLSTKNKLYWKKLIEAASRRYWLSNANHGVVIFEQSIDCGYIRTYRFSGVVDDVGSSADVQWTRLRDENALYEILDSPDARLVFSSWCAHKDEVNNLPTVFVKGRLQNTNVGKALIFTKGDGCAVCGQRATCRAATTFGHFRSATHVYLAVCAVHIEDAKSFPSIFGFLASLFILSIDWKNLQKTPSIPDELISFIHAAVAADLQGEVASAEKRKNGWHLTIRLPTGWRWVLRLRSFTDYAYLLFDPNQKDEIYKADSAPHHPEVPFFPMHQHSRPGSKKEDELTPSFLYGHPLLDLKRLRAVGSDYGAY